MRCLLPSAYSLLVKIKFRHASSNIRTSALYSWLSPFQLKSVASIAMTIWINSLSGPSDIWTCDHVFGGLNSTNCSAFSRYSNIIEGMSVLFEGREMSILFWSTFSWIASKTSGSNLVLVIVAPVTHRVNGLFKSQTFAGSCTVALNFVGNIYIAILSNVAYFFHDQYRVCPHFK